MNLIKKCFAAAVLISASISTQATVISFDDISGGVAGVDVVGPASYTFSNFDALLDGNFSSNIAQERFIGIGDGVDSNNPITISAMFDDLYTIESFGLAHDWGSIFNQQIEALTFNLLDSDGAIFSFSFSGLAQNTLSTIDLWSGSIVNVVGFEVVISDLQNTNLEIRELVITGSAQEASDDAAAVNAPALGALLALVCGLILFRKR